MLEYAHFLLRRFVAPYYHKGSQEVHVLFDNPGRHSFSPKQWKQAKRDENSPVSAVHTHITALRDDTLIPRNWSEFVHCRECKKGLTKYLAVRLLTVAPTVMMTPEQKFMTAGPFEGDLTDLALSVTGSGLACTEPQLTCTADESDMRIWRHSCQSALTRQLIFSPDTDVYIIGLQSFS